MMLSSESHAVSEPWPIHITKRGFAQLCDNDLKMTGSSNFKILISINNNPLCLCHLQLV